MRAALAVYIIVYSRPDPQETKIDNYMGNLLNFSMHLHQIKSSLVGSRYLSYPVVPASHRLDACPVKSANKS